MSKRTKWLAVIGVIAALIFGLQIAAYAGQIGQNGGFEDDDGNLDPGDVMVPNQPSPQFDWNSFNPLNWTGTAPDRVVAKQQAGWDFDGLEDAQATTSDDGFAGGTKQDFNCPTVIDAKAPNKDDLERVYFANRKATTGPDAGDIFLELAWVRIAQNSTTAAAHVGFEFNQGDTACGSGSDGLVERTAGDILIVYDFEGGSKPVKLTLRKWVTSGPCEVSSNSSTPNGCWGPAKELTAAPVVAEAKVNLSPVDDDIAPTPETLGPVEFGEAGINLTDAGVFTPGTCTSFGNAYAVTRSTGNSGTAQMKDLVGPGDVNINNCGGITVHKQTVPSPDPTTNTFDYTSPGLTPASFTMEDGDSQSFGTEVQAGTYTITETDANQNNFTLSAITCTVTGSGGSTTSNNLGAGSVTIDLKPQDSVDCTFVNTLQQGAFRILKDSTKGGAVSQAGAVFNYSGPNGDSGTVTDNGTGDEDDTVGEVCVSGRNLGDYTITETTAPAGYGLPVDTSETATVVTGTNCGDNPPTGAAVVTFTDPPLADIQVNFRDGGSGDTNVTSITCAPQGGSNITPSSTTAPDGWDDSATFEDLVIDPSPRTFNCTVVIDP